MAWWIESINKPIKSCHECSVKTGLEDAGGDLRFSTLAQTVPSVNNSLGKN